MVIGQLHVYDRDQHEVYWRGIPNLLGKDMSVNWAKNYFKKTKSDFLRLDIVVGGISFLNLSAVYDLDTKPAVRFWKKTTTY